MRGGNRIACARGARTDKEIRNLRAGVRPIDSVGALASGPLSIRPIAAAAPAQQRWPRQPSVIAERNLKRNGHPARVRRRRGKG
jgi:hypothetical protein